MLYPSFFRFLIKHLFTWFLILIFSALMVIWGAYFSYNWIIWNLVHLYRTLKTRHSLHSGRKVGPTIINFWFFSLKVTRAQRFGEKMNKNNCNKKSSPRTFIFCLMSILESRVETYGNKMVCYDLWWTSPKVAKLWLWQDNLTYISTIFTLCHTDSSIMSVL